MTTPYHMPPMMAWEDPDVQVANAAIPEEAVDRIRRYGDRLIEINPLPAKVGFHEYTREVGEKRHAMTQWLNMPGDDPSTKWIYDLAADAIQQANGKVWNYDIWGFYDQMHYVQYHAPGDHFGWHQDRGDDWRRPQRKLALAVMLSDPFEYEGGEFQIFDGQEITLKAKEKGSVIVFPSFIQHRVLPVTSGVRRSLIAWACGPRFR